MPTDMTFRTDDLVLGSWTHVGRVWTSGEPFLVLDASLLAAWRGSEEQFEEVVSLGWEVATVRVGSGVAGIVATDGTVNDEGWLEIFQSGPDRLAVVQALGDPYRRVLRDALAYPNEADDDGGHCVAERRAGAVEFGPGRYRRCRRGAPARGTGPGAGRLGATAQRRPPPPGRTPDSPARRHVPAAGALDDRPRRRLLRALAPDVPRVTADHRPLSADRALGGMTGWFAPAPRG